MTVRNHVTRAIRRFIRFYFSNNSQEGHKIASDVLVRVLDPSYCATLTYIYPHPDPHTVYACLNAPGGFTFCHKLKYLIMLFYVYIKKKLPNVLGK